MTRTSARLLTAALGGPVVLVTIALYWPALGAGFVGDDFMILHRLRDVSGPGDVLRFFRGEFFEYYRPLGFLSHALDWSIAGANPRQFHLTNLVLHGVNGVLVLLIAGSLARRASMAEKGQPWIVSGTIAGLLFLLDASNHEAVVWVSARFDLLGTGWSLAAVLWMVSGARGNRWGPAVLFFAAVLSKESAVALPIAAAAWAVFCLRATTRETIARVAPWVVVLLIYALLRQAAGGVPATGGAGRAPKLIVFAATLTFLIWCAGERWIRLRDWLLTNRRTVAGALTIVVLGICLLPLLPLGALSTFAREKLAVAGFSTLYLIAPLTDVPTGGGYLQPIEQIYWKAALVGVPLVALVVWSVRRKLLNADLAWFLGALLLATLLPISALTEGRRYLYLPSAVIAIAAGVVVVRLRGRWYALALGAVSLLLAVSSFGVVAKLDDWRWAGAMTADGARLVDDALAPTCNTGHVVFLTSPVGVHGVYSHFYYETFELPRGCIPATFQVVSRVLRLDTRVNAQWTGADTIELTIPDYRGNLVLSSDLRQFDMPLNDVRTRTVQTPLGELRAEAVGPIQRLTLTMPRARRTPAVFFYFSDGRMHRLAKPPG